MARLEIISHMKDQVLTTYYATTACSDRSCNTGVLAVGWGSGTADFPYLSDPLAAIKAKTASVTSSTSDTDLNAAKNAATGKSVAIVFITSDSGEEYITVEGNAGDRNNMDPWHGGNAVSIRHGLRQTPTTSDLTL